MIILGLNAFHGDSSAALVRDGVLVAAAEEERFRRIKHWAGFPSQAIAYCLREAGLALADVDHVAVNQDSRANLWRQARLYLVTTRPSLALVLDRLRNRRARARHAEICWRRAFPAQRFRGEVHQIEHHLAHLSSAFHVSPFDEAVVVSVDGFGDFASAAWGVGQGSDIAVDGRVYFPHSLGIFYQALTQYLGFPHYGDEYKVMGLAPYGEPHAMRRDARDRAPASRTALTSSICLFPPSPGADRVPMGGRRRRSSATCSRPRSRSCWARAARPDEPLDDRHRDIARSVQAMYEEAFFHLIGTLQQRYGLDRSRARRRLRHELGRQRQGAAR